MKNQQIKTSKGNLYFHDGTAWRTAVKVTCADCGKVWYARKNRKQTHVYCRKCRVIGDRNPMYGKPSWNSGTAIDERILKRDKHRRRKKWAFEHKGGKCCMCGVDNLPMPCFHFHHLNNKEWDISKLFQLKDWKNMLKKELSKCILVCANCHITLHYKERF